MKGAVAKLKVQLALIIIYLFNLLPIKKNKIFLFSYYGNNFGCNPKYITNDIIDRYPEGRFDIVWAFNEPRSKPEVPNVRKVKTMSLKYFYELCTAKVVITNHRTTNLFVKRRNQYYIQTWHSSLRLKQIERDAKHALPAHYIKMAHEDSSKCDLLLSGCKYSTEIFQRAFWYDGEIFEHGTPRNDLLVHNERTKKHAIKQKVNISEGTNVLLYAPTFRKNHDLSIYQMNHDWLAQTLKNRFGGEWVILIKLHPHLMNKSEQLVHGSNVRDVTDYEDIQELLLIADVLISDYSSLMFDFSITERPCFLYVPDIKAYTAKERELYFDLDALPFVSAMNEEALLKNIERFNRDRYKRKITAFHESIGSYEDGKASKILLERIQSVCFGEKESERHEAV